MKYNTEKMKCLLAILTHFKSMFHFYAPSEHKNQRFFDVFRRYGSLFQEEISACALVLHVLCYRHVRSCEIQILFSLMMEHHSRLSRLSIVSESKHWVTWSRRTGDNLSFLRGKRIHILVLLLNKIIFNSFLPVV